MPIKIDFQRLFLEINHEFLSLSLSFKQGKIAKIAKNSELKRSKASLLRNLILTDIWSSDLKLQERSFSRTQFKNSAFFH